MSLEAEKLRAKLTELSKRAGAIKTELETLLGVEWSGTWTGQPAGDRDWAWKALNHLAAAEDNLDPRLRGAPVDPTP